jgi:hypothetical protein
MLEPGRDTTNCSSGGNPMSPSQYHPSLAITVRSGWFCGSSIVAGYGGKSCDL